MSDAVHSRAEDERGLPVAFWLALVAGLVLRLYALDLRALHHDEAVNWYFAERWRGGEFRYDPSNYHGPTLFFLLALSRALGDLDEWTLRGPIALLSAALPLLLLPLRGALGRHGLVLAAWLLATSPTLLWIGRYAIHETLLIATTLGALAAFWHAYATHSVRGWRFGWLALALAFATKETAFVGLGAAAAGALLAWWLATPQAHGWGDLWRPALGLHWQTWRARLGALALAAVLLAAFYTNGGTHPQGLLDFARAFAHWSDTGASGAGHEKAWWYYATLLLRYEPAALLLALAALPGFARRAPLAVLGVVWLVLVGLAYSVTPYKTPWLVANLTLPLILLAALGAQALADAAPRVARAVVVLAVLASAALGAHLNLVRFDSTDEPLVYVQHTREVRGFAQRIRALAAAVPAERRPRVAVISPEQWPLPFYLRGEPDVAYHASAPERLDAPVIALDTRVPEVALPTDAAFAGEYAMRPGQVWRLYLRAPAAPAPGAASSPVGDRASLQSVP